MPRRLLTFGVACASLFMLAGSALATNPPGGDLLPDLVMRPPRDLAIGYAGTERRLRFTIESGNVDTGPLEIFPVTGPGYDDCNHDGDPTNDRTVLQRIYRDANNDGVFTRGVDTAYRTQVAGCMVFHPAHNHWHFEDYAQFELRNTAGATVVMGTKTSFCLTDSIHSTPGLPGSPSTAYYTTCDQVTPQGLSVGWSDVYGSGLPGQYLVINGVPDGDYCVVSTVDPLNKIVESNGSNNSGSSRFRLTGDTVTLLSNTPCVGGSSASFVYDDSLQWDNWSWNTVVNPSVTSPIFSGTRSMSATFNAGWAGLSLHSSVAFSTAPFTQLHFAILPGSIPLSGLVVSLYNTSGVGITDVNPAPYASPAGGGWFVVNIPLSALGGSNMTITRVTIQEHQGAAQPTLYVDEVSFVGSAPPPPPPPPPPPASYAVYDDSLHWDDWSWNTTVNPNVTSPVFSGTSSLSATFNAGWAGLSLHNAGFNTAPYGQLHFAILPGSIPLSGLVVSLYNTAGAAIVDVNPQPYASASGAGWFTVNVPLSALGGANTTITRVTIQEQQGTAEPTLYVDELTFVGP